MYAAASPALIAQYRRLDRIRGLLHSPVKALLVMVAGKTEAGHATGRAWVWGEVRDDAGGTAVARLTLGDPYQFTVDSSLALARLLLEGKPGEGRRAHRHSWPDGVVENLPGCGPVAGHDVVGVRP